MNVMCKISKKYFKCFSYIVLLYTSCAFSFEFKLEKLEGDTSLYVLKFSPYDNLMLHKRASDFGYKRKTVAKMAALSQAKAAINASFFRIRKENRGDGLPSGILKSNNKWHGIAYKHRGAVGFDPYKKKIIFDRVTTKSQLVIDDIPQNINQLNAIPIGRSLALFTDSMMGLLDANSFRIGIIKNNRVTEVVEQGKIRLSPGSTAIINPSHHNIQIDDKAIFDITIQGKYNNESWNDLPYIIGGAPLLIYDGQALDFSGEKLSQKFIKERAARTVLSVDSAGNWCFVVVHSGFYQESQGLTLLSLQKKLLELGMIYAINLDGGYSTSLYINNEDTKLRFGSRGVSDMLYII